VWGEREREGKRRARAHSLQPRRSLSFSLLFFPPQLVGDFNACQEMEDFGELDAALKLKD